MAKPGRYQRYKCNSCGLSFIEGDRRQKTPIEAQALAVLLYGMGKSSYGFIAKLFKVSRIAVYYWIHNFCEDIPPPVVPEGNYDLEFDEMWHFINSKKQTLDMESSGSCSEENHCLSCRQS